MMTMQAVTLRDTPLPPLFPFWDGLVKSMTWSKYPYKVFKPLELDLLLVSLFIAEC